MAEEERLQDALAAVGDTLGPADVPALTLPPHRRLRPSRRTGLAAAAAASLAAVIAGAFFTIGSAGSGDREPVLGHVPPPTMLRDPQMSIFLCAKTSANPACRRRDVTAAQREAIKTRLTALPEVRSIEFESKEEAFERFRAQFADTPGVAQSAREGDIPEAFRLVLRKPDYRRVASAVANMPGVDQIVNENAMATPPS